MSDKAKDGVARFTDADYRKAARLAEKWEMNPSVDEYAEIAQALADERADLYAALERAALALRTLAEEGGDVSFWNEGGDGYEACEIARAALRKARGEA